MSKAKTYQVIQDFNSEKDYRVKLDNRFKTTLSEFQKVTHLDQKILLKNYQNPIKL